MVLHLFDGSRPSRGIARVRPIPCRHREGRKENSVFGLSVPSRRFSWQFTQTLFDASIRKGSASA